MSTSTNTADVPPTQTYSKTFYRRQLPETAISFSSPKGREVFASAMASGGTYSVLNALAVDPRRSWKGPWRW